MLPASNTSDAEFRAWPLFATLEQDGGIIWVLCRTSALIILSTLCGIVFRNSQKWKDTCMLIILFLLQNRETIYGLTLSLISILPVNGYKYVTIVLGLQAIIAWWSSGERRGEHAKSTESFLRPLIFPCRTTHTRMFPTKHSFSYSYLLVGVPVNEDSGHGTSLLSTNEFCTRSWLSVHSEDYLQRENAESGKGLRAKLDPYLRSQNINSDRYPHAYLVTAPRILGFSFNPVSFWYLYNEQQVLAAMILEVNNTFDERRMYFMEREIGYNSVASNGFTHSWAKDFHVSPFNDRDGSYSLTAKDPFLAAVSGLHNVDGDVNINVNANLDNKIVLRSPDGKAKIIARVFSTESVLDPNCMSTFQSWLFLVRWWWVGFMTNPRILREARLLWIKKLQVFYRPEVLVTSIGRNETREENGLETFFRHFLKVLVNKSGTGISICYTPASGLDRGKQIFLKSPLQASNFVNTVEIQIMTPAFYAELVKARSTEQAFASFCFEANEATAMLTVSNHDQLRLLLKTTISASNVTKKWNCLDHPHVLLRSGKAFDVLKTCASFVNIYVKNPKHAPTDFDIFVDQNMTALRDMYSHFASKILLADRFAFGFMPLLEFYTVAIGLLLVLLVSQRMNGARLLPGHEMKFLEVILPLMSLHYLRARWTGFKYEISGRR